MMYVADVCVVRRKQPSFCDLRTTKRLARNAVAVFKMYVCDDVCLIREYGLKCCDVKGDRGPCVLRAIGCVVPPQGNYVVPASGTQWTGEIRKLETATFNDRLY